MKLGILVITFSAILATGCIRNPADETKKNLEKILEDHRKRTEEIAEKVITSLSQGGQPGQITVSGIIVKKDGDQILLDERLKVEQIGGKNADGHQTTVSDAYKADFSEEAKVSDFSQVTGLKTYINFGCENLSEAETKNLVEQTNVQAIDRHLFLSATKIFFCGKHSFNKSLLFVSLTASELVLKDTTILIEPAIYNITLNAEKLVLEGENLVEARGSDGPITIFPGPSIQFSLAREIHGEGRLTLRTLGGNIVSETQQESE